MGNIKGAGKTVFFLISTVLFSGVFSANAYAGNCDQFAGELHEVKGLVKRTSLLAVAMKKCPDDYLVTYYYAYNLERRRKYEQAIHYYKLAIELHSDYARSFFGLGDTFLVLERNKEAIAAYENGLRLEPTNIWAVKSMKKARQSLSTGKAIKARECPASMTIMASSVQAISSGGLAVNYVPVH